MQRLAYAKSKRRCAAGIVLVVSSTVPKNKRDCAPCRLPTSTSCQASMPIGGRGVAKQAQASSRRLGGLRVGQVSNVGKAGAVPQSHNLERLRALSSRVCSTGHDGSLCSERRVCARSSCDGYGHTRSSQHAARTPEPYHHVCMFLHINLCKP